ncbi:hypothetical protein QQX98_012807 [Neonectria punicea]|uniref:Amidase domain-containing protein n=1 Tax=Neonectria punicea TaxID=979145 RepID=A0ABR1GHX7_9HYPO
MLGFGSLRPGQSRSSTVSSRPLRLATIADLRAGLNSGQFTYKQLVEAYINRIHQVNDKLRPVSQLSDNAVATA